MILENPFGLTNKEKQEIHQTKKKALEVANANIEQNTKIANKVASNASKGAKMWVDPQDTEDAHR